jgi:hypothetical protein
MIVPEIAHDLAQVARKLEGFPVRLIACGDIAEAPDIARLRAMLLLAFEQQDEGATAIAPMGRDHCPIQRSATRYRASIGLRSTGSCHSAAKCKAFMEIAFGYGPMTAVGDGCMLHQRALEHVVVIAPSHASG